MSFASETRLGAKKQVRPVDVEIDALVGRDYSLQGEQNVARFPQIPAQDFGILHATL